MEKKKINFSKWIFLAFLVVSSGSILYNRYNAPYQHNQGFIFGTTYNITYKYSDDLNKEILEKLNGVDNALSPFNKKSLITFINSSSSQSISLSSKFSAASLDSQLSAISYFQEVFKLAEKISDDTDGAFDITVAPLVNAWGFGFKSGKMPDKHALDSLKALVGYKKVRLKDFQLIKDNPKTMLDCSAIAKGYGCDVVAHFLDSKGITNYMVEIGGEIVVKGKNDKDSLWNVGVVKPTDDSLSINTELQTVLKLTDTGMATSGNYRNFYYKGNKKYAHTIDPKTGYPVQHNLLSATVLAPTCAEADAYATAFMVMGMKKAKAVLERNPQLKAYFIYSDEKGNFKTWSNL